MAGICALLCLSTTVQAVEVGGVAIHGFVSQGYIKTDDVNYLAETKKGTYQFNEAGINFNYTKNKLRVGAQVFSRDLGDLGNNDVVLDWAMGEYRIFDELGVRAGRIKMPFGFYNQGRDVDLLRTPIFLPSAVYDEGLRDVVNAYNGFGLFGILDAKVVGDFEYELFIGSMSLEEDGLFIQDKMEDVRITLENDLPLGITGAASGMTVDCERASGGSLRWTTPVPGLRLGVSALTTDMEVNTDLELMVSPLMIPGGLTVPAKAWVDVRAESQVFSGEFTWDRLTLASEYNHLRLASTDHMQQELLKIDSSDDVVSHEGGWYASGTYQVLDWLTLGLYYSEFYADLEDKDGDQLGGHTPKSYAWQKEWVPTLRFDPVQNWVIKLETHFVDGSARCYNFNNTYKRADNWNLYAIKTSYSF